MIITVYLAFLKSLIGTLYKFSTLTSMIGKSSSPGRLLVLINITTSLCSWGRSPVDSKVITFPVPESKKDKK